MKQRIWELDALRGICVLGMVLVHLFYDASVLFRLSQASSHPLFRFVSAYGGIFFVVISGICVTFSRSSVKRGLLALGCGLICTAVTAGMYLLQFSTKGIIIYFGVLHCLGTCMLLWPLCKRLPAWVLATVGIAMVVAGYYLLENVRVEATWLFPVGLLHRGFSSSDYFPLLPNFGYFLLGAGIGKTLYKNRQSLFPSVRAENPFVRFFSFCGRHSLLIYLGHQPILTGIFYLLTILKN